MTSSTAIATAAPPLLQMRNITKSYPGVRALSGVDIELHAGEVLALVGENGAGKSTLIKTLGGAIAPDAGTIEIDGHPVPISHPVAARRLGVSIIYQEFNLVPTLSVRENVFLGGERTRLGVLSHAHERRRAEKLFEEIGIPLSMDALCRDLSVAQQQAVEIAKALTFDARVLLMDEPSAALSPHEVERLFSIVRKLKSRGLGIIYVSHRLDEIFEIADRVTVLRDGALVETKQMGEVSRQSLIEMMVGRTLEQEFPPRKVEPGERRLAVKGLRRGSAVQGVNFEVNRGEIVALTGLVGAGRTETARLIFGADRADAGEITVDGRICRIRHPRQAIRAGICLLTEDRKNQGLVLNRSLCENFGLPNMKRFAPRGVLRLRREQVAFRELSQQLNIRMTSHRQAATTLSGGNQQKVVLAKWLASHAEVFIFDEPTRGIDVGAKYEIYLLMNELAAQGKAILMISGELPEVLGMADRILVMHGGRITGEIRDVAGATQEQIMELAIK